MKAHKPTLREQAAQFLTEAGLPTKASDIIPVSGYWLRCDCYRWELHNHHGYSWGCWETLQEFVKGCKARGGAAIDRKNLEVHSK